MISPSEVHHHKEILLMTTRFVIFLQSNELSGKRSSTAKDERPSKKLKESSGKGSQSKGGSKGKVQVK